MQTCHDPKFWTLPVAETLVEAVVTEAFQAVWSEALQRDLWQLKEVEDQESSGLLGTPSSFIPPGRHLLGRGQLALPPTHKKEWTPRFPGSITFDVRIGFGSGLGLAIRVLGFRPKLGLIWSKWCPKMKMDSKPYLLELTRILPETGELAPHKWPHPGSTPPTLPPRLPRGRGC